MSHAILSPSAASRWMSCTPSARLEQSIPDEDKSFALEGTLAHELGELLLRCKAGYIDPEDFNRELARIKENEYYCTELQSYAEEYASFVWERFTLALRVTKDAVIGIEQRLSFTDWVPEGFGTGDAVIVADGTLELIDLKYGKGVSVSAVGNKQLMIYALGAIAANDFLYAIKKVRVTIYQPRIDNINDWEITVPELMAWAETELKPKAQLAWKGAGEYVSGKHCQFCKAKAQCKALATEMMAAVADEFRPADLMPPEDIAVILSKADLIKSWLTSIEDFALKAALNGTKFEGFKLVEGRSNRKYADDAKVVETLISNGFGEDIIYEPKKLKTITAMEKLLTKKTFSALLSEYIIKPQGKPTLAPADDKRREYNSAEQDFSNIINA